MHAPIICVETAKQALASTKEVEFVDQRTSEVKTQVLVDMDAAQKAIKFMAGYAFKRPNQE